MRVFGQVIERNFLGQSTVVGVFKLSFDAFGQFVWINLTRVMQVALTRSTRKIVLNEMGYDVSRIHILNTPV